MEHANVVAPAGPLLDEAGHEHERLHGGIVFRLGIGNAELARAGERKPRQDRDADGHRLAKIHSRNEGHDPCPLKRGREYSHRPKPVNRPAPSAAGYRSPPARRINHAEALEQSAPRSLCAAGATLQGRTPAIALASLPRPASTGNIQRYLLEREVSRRRCGLPTDSRPLEKDRWLKTMHVFRGC